MAARDPERVSRAGLVHLAVVYLVWGSTYLAIRLAVRSGGGFPPFRLGASRTLLAGALLLCFGALRRARLWPTKAEWGTLALSGLLLWVGGNGLVNWGEQRSASGYAALLVGTLPLWVAVIEAVADRRFPAWRLLGAIGVGFAGLAVLSYPVVHNGSRADFYSIAALLVAPLSWGAGSVLQARRPVALSAGVSSGIQQIVGGLGFVLVAVLMREPKVHPSGQAWMAWGYLVVAGSIFAFTSFLQALRLLPTRVVMTYAYVNPVIAVFLGWLVLREPITAWTIAGTLLVLVGVAGTFRARPRPVAAH
jgi:drug/metabolite transporter (DMT)-like permease